MKPNALKPQWLERHVAPLGPYLALCLTQEAFAAAMKGLSAHETAKEPFVGPSSNARTWVLEHPTNKAVVCVVCLGDSTGRTATEIAGLLVHEAVHVWRFHCEALGEERPAAEQEAYGIQYISQILMEAFAEHRS